MKNVWCIVLSFLLTFSFQNILVGCDWCIDWSLPKAKESEVFEPPFENDVVNEGVTVSEGSLPQNDSDASLESSTPLLAEDTSDISVLQKKPQKDATRAVDSEAFASLLSALKASNSDGGNDGDFSQLNFAEIIENIFSGEDEENSLKESSSSQHGADEPFDAEESSKRDEMQKHAARTFYENYLAVFYPKALIIADHFFDTQKPMCPLALNAALSEFVTMLSDKTWFAFQKNPKGFKHGEHWEVIIEECRRLDTALSKACYSLTRKKIVQKSNFFLLDRDRNDVSLVSYLREHNLNAVSDFYGYFADYLIRMFNEGIHSENLKQASSYAFEYTEIIEKIPESSFDRKYQEHAQINKELLSELRKKIAVNSVVYSNENDEDDDDIYTLPGF